MQSGFTLIELMIVITILAILSAAGIPSYQSYLQKAALTDVLQLVQPYKIAIELCVFDTGQLQGCSEKSHGIPAAIATRYVSHLTVIDGLITLQHQQTLNGLTLTLQPEYQHNDGQIIWRKRCDSDNSSLKSHCQHLFRYDNIGEQA